MKLEVGLWAHQPDVGFRDIVGLGANDGNLTICILDGPFNPASSFDCDRVSEPCHFSYIGFFKSGDEV